MDKDNGTSGFMNAPQNGREEELLDAVWNRLIGITTIDPAPARCEITREQLAEAMTDAALLAIDQMAEAGPEDRTPLPTLVHELECMGARAADAGMGGNALICRRAAALVGKIEKLVTRLLPRGQAVHHATYGDLVVYEAVLRHSGEIDVMCDRPDGGWHQLPVAELEPIYEIRAEAPPHEITKIEINQGDRISLSLDSIEYRGKIGDGARLSRAPVMLEASDRPATIHRICRHNPGDDEFPS